MDVRSVEVFFADKKPTAFMAELSSNMVNPSKNTVVVFDNVLTNIGGNYKSQSGMFIADTPGIYNFNLVATSQKKLRGAWVGIFDISVLLSS